VTQGDVIIVSFLNVMGTGAIDSTPLSTWATLLQPR